MQNWFFCHIQYSANESPNKILTIHITKMATTLHLFNTSTFADANNTTSIISSCCNSSLMEKRIKRGSRIFQCSRKARDILCTLNVTFNFAASEGAIRTTTDKATCVILSTNISFLLDISKNRTCHFTSKTSSIAVCSCALSFYRTLLPIATFSQSDKTTKKALRFNRSLHIKR